MTLTRLERLGFEVAAGQWLEMHRGYGRLLWLFVQAGGAIVTYDELLRDDYRRCRRDPSQGGLKVRLSNLRKALADVGAPVELQCVWGIGYQLLGDVRAVFEAVEASA